MGKLVPSTDDADAGTWAGWILCILFFLGWAFQIC